MLSVGWFQRRERQKRAEGKKIGGLRKLQMHELTTVPIVEVAVLASTLESQTFDAVKQSKAKYERSLS